MTFIDENFLLHSEFARELYHKHAAIQPIFDYHCHLPPEDIAANKTFTNMYEIWLAGDHYKWRAMRSNGISEDLCTGDAPEYDKFMAFVKTVPAALRNPMYHWSHLELKRYFDLDLIISENTAEEIWQKTNEKLAKPEMSVSGILNKFKVKVVCTTDDPAEPLTHHKVIKDSELNTRVYPTFRPDKALWVSYAKAYKEWIEKLSSTSDTHITKLSRLMEALNKRHDDFHEMGCRLSDHGLPYSYSAYCSKDEAEAIFNSTMRGKNANGLEQIKFASYLMDFFGELDAEKGWTKQLHLGPIRNNNSIILKSAGPDTGCDSIGDFFQGESLSRYLDKLNSKNKLPKTILYNINPRDNYMMATMIGNFQDGSIPGKIQFGSGWWFLDQKEGMEMQMNALSNCGLLSRFVGMTTDSRSFLSYTRHEYFRRILCNLIGQDMANGELPEDMDLLGKLVEDVCYNNAVRYFGLEVG